MNRPDSGGGSQPLEAIEDEVEPERELDVVVAAPEAAFVGRRHRQLAEPWKHSR